MSQTPSPIELEFKPLLEDSERTAMYFRMVKTFQYALLYFASSISLTLFIKHVVTYSETKYPLTNLSLQMFVNTFFSGIVSYFIVRNQLRVFHGSHNAVSFLMVIRKLFNWTIFKKLSPYGCLSGLDFGLSNYSFSFISVSLYTMLKSSVPIFVLLVSFLSKMEKPTLSLNISIFLISLGIGISAGTSSNFHIIGVTFVIIASMLAGVRLVYVQYILQPNNNNQVQEYERIETTDHDIEQPGDTPASIEATPTAQLAEYITDNDAIKDHHQKRLGGKKLDTNLSSVQLFFLTAPIIGLTVLPFAMVLEGARIWNKFLHISSLEIDANLPDQNQKIYFMQAEFIFRIFLNVFIGAFFAFFLNISEFLLIKETSGLTLTVLGILKELMLIGSSMFVFQDEISYLGIVGYSISLVGIVLYKINRFYKMKQAIHESMAKQQEQER